MARKVGISGEGTGVRMSGADTWAKGVGDVASGLSNLGQGIKNVEEYKHKAKMDQLKIEQAQAQAAAASQAALSKSQVDLYKAEAEDRVRVFKESQKNIWNQEALKQNQMDFEQREKDHLISLQDGGQLTDGAFAEIQGMWMPSYISQAHGDTTIQVNEAAVKSSIQNYDSLIVKATNRGDAETANNITRTMLELGLIDANTYQTKIEENGRTATRGAYRLNVYNEMNTDNLWTMYKEMGDPNNKQYAGLSLEERANLQQETMNHMQSVLKAEQLPAVKGLKAELSAGTLTEEKIWASPAPEFDKQMLSLALKGKIEWGYKSIKEKDRDELSKLINDWMDGGFIGSGGTIKQAQNIIDFVNEKKIPDYVIMDILSIMEDGYAGDNAVNFLMLDRNDVKYPSKMKGNMEIFNTMFDRLTSDLTPLARLNGYGKAYGEFYKMSKHVGTGYTGGILTQTQIYGEIPETMNQAASIALNDVRNARIQRDIQKNATSSMGIITTPERRGFTLTTPEQKSIQSPQQKLSSEMEFGAPLQGVPKEDWEEVRQIMKVNNTSADKAWRFLQAQRGNK